MIFFVRYVDSETLDIYTQLVKLIEIDAKDFSVEKLFHAFQCEMSKLQIPFNNIIALSCDSVSVMVRKFSSFKTKLQRVCSRLLTLPCPCYSAFLAAYAATNEIPIFCEKFLKKVSTYIKSNHKRSALFREFSKCFQKTDHKILKLYAGFVATHM